MFIHLDFKLNREHPEQINIHETVKNVWHDNIKMTSKRGHNKCKVIYIFYKIFLQKVILSILCKDEDENYLLFLCFIFLRESLRRIQRVNFVYYLDICLNELSSLKSLWLSIVCVPNVWRGFIWGGSEISKIRSGMCI